MSKETPSAGREPVPNNEKEAKQQDLSGRLEKLARTGAINPMDLLKMRMDLVTQLLVPDSLVPTLEGAWEGLMEQVVEHAEQELARQTLLEGVRPSQ